MKMAILIKDIYIVNAIQGKLSMTFIIQLRKKKKEKQKRTYLGTQKTTDNTIYTRFQIIQSIHNEKSYKALIKKQNKTKQNTKKSKTI